MLALLLLDRRCFDVSVSKSFRPGIHMSYWASLEIEMSLLGKRLSAGQFIKESVGVVK